MDSLNSIVFSPPNLSSSNQTLVYERYSKDVDTRLEDPIPSIKVISLGDPGVGKSCLIRRYCEKKFTVEYISTIGIDYGVKTIILHGEPLKIHFWDMAGHSSYFHVRNEFYGDTNGILLIFDVRSKDTFVRLSAWIQEFKHYIKSPIITFLVGNKVEQGNRAVPQELAISFAKEHGLEYFETSANTGVNVDEMFETLFSACIKEKGMKSMSESIE